MHVMDAIHCFAMINYFSNFARMQDIGVMEADKGTKGKNKLW